MYIKEGGSSSFYGRKEMGGPSSLSPLIFRLEERDVQRKTYFGFSISPLFFKKFYLYVVCVCMLEKDDSKAKHMEKHGMYTD